MRISDQRWLAAVANPEQCQWLGHGRAMGTWLLSFLIRAGLQPCPWQGHGVDAGMAFCMEAEAATAEE